ncbi:MAG: ATP-binding protein [Planctomycetota bacterium]
MWRHFQTLRFKLAALYLVVFGAILTALCVVILTVREENLRQNFDERLQDRAEAMVEKILIATEDQAAPASQPRALSHLNPFRFPGYYFQLRLEDETIVERSRNLGSITLPLSDAARSSKRTGRPALETLRGDAAQALIGNPGEIRLLTLHHDRPATTPFYLQVAVNLRRVNETIRELRRLLITLIPGGLLVAAVASWTLVGRSLAPIRQMADVAARLGAHDLTLRVDAPGASDEVGDMVATVNHMLDRLSTAFESQGRFIANVSHELKTPLSVLLGGAQVLMQKERSSEEYARFVASIQDEVRSLSQTVDSLLTLARAEAGIPTSHASEVSLNEAVMDAVQRCQIMTKQQEVRLVPTLAPPREDGLEPIVLGDPELLRLAFTNLLRNAIRYSPAEGSVEISVTLKNAEALVTVRDHGPGIPPEHIDKVFDRFYRVPQDDIAFRGIGLGLTIVRGIAVVHGGLVGASNCPEGGCEFTVHLPVLRNTTIQTD